MKKRNITIRVHPAGSAVLAVAIAFLDSRAIFSAVSALAVHEGTHLAAMVLCGMNDCAIELTPFGGMADVRSFDSYPAWKRMLCAAAGVLGSLFAAILCLLFAPRTLFWHAFFNANLSLAMMNALPAWPLDGARILTAIAAKYGKEHTVRNLLSWITVAIGVFFVSLGLYGIWHGIMNPSLLIIGPYLCYAAHAEGIFTKIRRLGAAERKLNKGTVLPVKAWAGTERMAEEYTFGILLGKMQQDQYHLLIQIDDKSGKIKRIWTEGEMLDHALSNGRNQQGKSIDKEFRL